MSYIPSRAQIIHNYVKSEISNQITLNSQIKFYI